MDLVDRPKELIEDEILAEWVREVKNEKLKIINLPEGLSDQELAVWYNDNEIYRIRCA